MNLGVFLIFLRIILNFFINPPEPNNENEVGTPLFLEAQSLYSNLAAENLPFKSFFLAYQGYTTLLHQHMLIRDSILTIIDYSQPSDRERLYVIDVKNQNLLYKSLVAHGKGSGEIMAESFSNKPASHQSSLGFYTTGQPYYGKHGFSLRIDGLENGINNNARTRAIVFHGASYVSMRYIEKNGRLGRSFGCPALPLESSRQIIDSIKDNSCVFIYAPDAQYFSRTDLINPNLYSQIILQ